MIQAINLRLLRNSEFIRFHKQVLEICENANPATLGIVPQVTNLKTLLTGLDTLFVKERGNQITDELEALDARRDTALTGIRMRVEGSTYHYEPAIKTAALAVLAAIDKYGDNLPRLNYLAETEVIENLADDLKSGELLAAAQTLDIVEWLKELTTANTAFNNRYLARNSEYAAKSESNMQEQRVYTIEGYRKLADHITAHATITPTDDYIKLVAEVNSLAGQYNQLLSNRNGGEEVVPEPPPVTGTPVA